MSAATPTPTPTLLLGDVQAGDQLAELGYDVTATTIVLGALAARDWRPCTTTTTLRSTAMAPRTSS